MKSDEKNQFSSNKNDIDPDMRSDKYDELRKDEKFHSTDKRNKTYTHDPNQEDYESNIRHRDPNNLPMKDIDRKNRNLNEPVNTGGWDLNHEESPNTHELHRVNEQRHHHHYDPNAKIKQPDENPNIEHVIHNPSKHKEFQKEVIRDKSNQFPEHYTSKNTNIR
jgi:hypothetical protein